MLNKILRCREAAKIILKELSNDRVNLVNVMPDDYMYYLLTSLNEKERRFILMKIFGRIPLDKFSDQTLECLYKSYWRYISRFAKMKDNFVIKWSHKINFMLLKQNVYGRHYKNYVSIPRPFSRRFHKLFPGFKYYRPCNLCGVDTQWFQDIDVSSPINIFIYNWINGYWGVGKSSSWAQSCGSEECYTSKKLFEFWGKNSVWFCMSCWVYLRWVYAATFPGGMSLIWLRNVNTAELRMQMAVLK